MTNLVRAALAASLLLFAIPSRAQVVEPACVDYGAPLRWRSSLEMDGWEQRVEVVGSTAIVAADRGGVHFVDVSNPEAPRLLATAETRNQAKDVGADGSLVVVADWFFGIQTIDMTNPSEPRVLGNFDTGGHSYAVDLVGTHAYVADREGGVLVFDVADPTVPKRLAVVSTEDEIWDVAFQDGWLYAVGGGFHVIDVTNPASPDLVLTLPVSGVHLALAGDLVYVGGTVVAAIDVSDPTQARQIATADVGSRDLSVRGGRMYVGDTNSLNIVDATDAGQLHVLGSVAIPLGVVGLDVTEDYIYAVSTSSGLHVVEIVATTAPPAAVGSIQTAEYVSQVFVEAGRAYVSTGYSPFQIVDLTDPTRPVLGRSIDVWGSDFAAGAGHLYHAGIYAGVNGAHVMDLATPGWPRIVVSIPTISGAQALALRGSMLFVASRHHLEIFDVTDPLHPIRHGSVEVPQFARDVAVDETHAYVASTERLSVIDVTNVDAPIIVGSMRGGASAVEVRGDHAFLASSEFHVVDVSDPTYPHVVATLFTEGVSDVEVRHNVAYLAAKRAGVVMVDITDPTRPSRIGGFDTADDAAGLHVDSDFVYVADGYAGLLILPQQCGTITPVSLTDVAAEPSGDRVVLSWAVSGDEFAGFDVERAMLQDGAVAGPFARLNVRPIPAAGPWTYTDVTVEPGASYVYRIVALDDGGGRAATRVLTVAVPTLAFVLLSPRPNPVRVSAQLGFALGRRTRASLEIFDVSGRLVRRVVDATLPAGRHHTLWDGADNDGRRLSNGVYLMRLRWDRGERTRRIVVVR